MGAVVASGHQGFPKSEQIGVDVEARRSHGRLRGDQLQRPVRALDPGEESFADPGRPGPFS